MRKSTVRWVASVLGGAGLVLTGVQAAEVQPQGAAVQPAAATQPAEGKPVIKADQVEHDFGVVWAGSNTVLKHTFTIRNDGDGVLKITKVQPSCGCTIAGQYPQEIKPGESGEFPFSLSSARVHGKFDKPISIFSNDPVTPEFKVKLRGEVKPFVEVSPPGAFFGRITSTQPAHRVINIRNNAEQPLELTLQPPADQKFKWDLREVEKGKAFELNVYTQPPYEKGSVNSTVTLTTNNDAQKTLTVNAVAMVPDRLELMPTVLDIVKPVGNRPPGQTQPMKRFMQFSNHGETPVKLVEVTSDAPELKFNVVEQAAGKTYTIQIEMPWGYEPPPEGRTITLKTTDAEKPVFTVPVRRFQTQPQSRPAVAQPPTPRPAETMVGQQVPEFKLMSSTGQEISSRQLADKVAVINFVAPNCPHCKRQLPRLESLRSTYAAKGVQFINVSETMGRAFTPQETMEIFKTLNVSQEFAVDPGNAIGRLFKAFSYPTLFVVGKDGKIAAVSIGNAADLDSKLKTQLDTLLEGKELPKVQASAVPTPNTRPAS